MPETDAQNELSSVKRALAEMQRLRARIAELESAPAGISNEPIAIIGAGLRFPGGVVDAASFWDLLSNGRDAITEIPSDRWNWRSYYDADPDAEGMMTTRHGGFVENTDSFDATFFGISPREADAMDPQHRLALEVAWEALENAGCPVSELQHSATGVFLGIANHDYCRALLSDLDHVDAYTGSGNSPAMVAGRLSYLLGLHGPSLAIDTSCSSSLVTVHLACQSLRLGECSLALAGGVNLILTPESSIALSRARMMAADGHCKTFDAAADGYVRSEGCGIVALKKLSRAQADGDRILAVIRGSAVNHDGRSGGLTAPNGPAQAAVVRQALAQAGVAPEQISYVETHGTGTSLGDPIEVDTLASIFGNRPKDAPLLLGAVKTNIGHAEAASGIAGLLKTVLVLEKRAIPPVLNLKQKNPLIRWEQMPLEVPLSLTAWNPAAERRFAGVSSFGFSGTNAHVVLEEAPSRPRADRTANSEPEVLALSAKTESALMELRLRYAAALRVCSPTEFGDFCYTANTGRTHFTHRTAMVADTSTAMAAALEHSVKDVGSSAARLFAEAPENGESSVSTLSVPDNPGRRAALESLAQQYIRGEKIDWKNLYSGRNCIRMALPTYPFERQRYWRTEQDSTGSIWDAAVQAAQSQSQQAPLGFRVESFPQKWECLDRLTLAEIRHTLHALGAWPVLQTPQDAASLAAACGIVPAQTRLLGSWLDLLVKSGDLKKDSETGKYSGGVDRNPEIERTSAWRETEAVLADDPFLLAYLKNCSRHLQGVLRGTVSPLETLFPREDPELVQNLYENSCAAKYANRMAAAAAQAACGAARGNRKLRVLEIGGGTGATTSAILPKLPLGRVSYFFTDLSELFLQRANARFSQFPFVRYGLLDIEDPAQVARLAGSFDVVIAANVLHATRNLPAALQSVSDLLTPGGTAIILEATRELIWREISIALVEGWQKPQDDLRGNRVLLDVSEWQPALSQAGFAETIFAPEAGSPAEAVGLHLLLARKPANARVTAHADGSAPHFWTRTAETNTRKEMQVSVLAELSAAPIAERREILRQNVSREIAAILGLPPDNLPHGNDRLMDLGMDSLMAVELKNRLASELELENISATLIFDYPTPDAIVGHLLALLEMEDSASESSAAVTSTVPEGRIWSAEEISGLSESELENLLRGQLEAMKDLAHG
jgi:3-oxoacyl-(acyl-carrier-protein) synthase/SAM-dependent methyltransferase/acyl carrier protein